MHILIAPNAFKNSLDATAAAGAIRDGFLKSKLTCSCECFPIGDGGDGTAALIIQKLNGVSVPVEVHDPLGRKMTTRFGLIENGQTAVIEMADASGLRLLQPDELNPLKASSYGTGEMIKAALDKGVTKIIIGMGGSATVDGACAMLKALGIKFLDNGGNELPDMPGSLPALTQIDTRQLDKRIFDCEVVVLCDVNNKLLGKEGAAHVFGPQKGAAEPDIITLDEALATFSTIAQRVTGKNMAEIARGGTAGGAAAGLYAFVNAALVNGIDYFLDLTSFDKALQNCDVVVTGEGSLDEQTLQGKGPYGVAYRAKQKAIPVIALAGKIPLQTGSKFRDFFDVLLPINNDCMDFPIALRLTAANLSRTACETGNLLALIK
ncbi:MAG: glycerate 3-kinase [Chitinophagaceae bacterium]